MRLISTILLLLLTLTAVAQIRGKVVSVADGDTFTLLTDDKTQVKVRLHGIDCPEKGQPFGNKAKEFTSDQVFGKMVTVEEKDVDRYGRTIGMVRLTSGEILNEQLLKEGLAWHYTYYDKNPLWREYEQQAKKKGKGLWSEAGAVAPWEFRRNRR